MNNISRLLFTSSVLLLFLGGCKKKTSCAIHKNTNTVNQNTSSQEPSVLVDSLNNVLEYDCLSFRVNSKFEADSIKSPIKSFKLNIRTKKDSIVWISVTALLGIEAFRIKIANDSIYMLNRLESTCTQGALSSFQGFGISDISDQTLIHLFLGRLFIRENLEIINTPVSDQFIHLQHKDSINSKLFTAKIHANQKSVYQQTMTDQIKNQSITATYTNFSSVGFTNDDFQIPLHQNFIINADQKIKVFNTLDKFAFEPLTFSFKIPSSYKRIDL